MSEKVFFSYSWKDMKVATRLYSDLVRSGLNVWRDQIDGDPTEDFREEYLRKIDECDYFMLLDSPNYRHRSNWCLDELERCIENRKKKSAPKIIVCLLEKDDSWRKEYISEKQRELFAEIKNHKIHTLFYDGTYDNGNVYQKSLTEICALFSKRFIPWNVMPSDRDLLEELSHSEITLCDKDRDLVLNGYKYISRLVDIQRDCDRHFQLWIEDCKSLGLNLFFPRWTYAVWLGQEIHQRCMLHKCLKEFQSLAKDFPLDPRCFRGWGCAAAQLNYNEESIKAFKRALMLMDLNENSWHKTHSQLEVLSVLGQVLMNNEDCKSALMYLKQALSIMESQGEYDYPLIQKIVDCLFFLKQITECKELLLRLTKKHLEGELFVALGTVFASENDNSNAMNAFQSACALQPSIKNRFYLLFRKKVMGILTKKEIEDALNEPVVQDEDNYWKGAICFHLLRNTRRAKDFYASCGMDYEWYE